MSDASLYQLLLDAATHHQAGRFAEADALYRKVLAIHPGNRDANHNLGVLAMQRGLGVASALPHFRAAWEADPSHAQHGLSYLRALVLAGDIDGARRLHAEGASRGLQWPSVDSLRQAPAPGTRHPQAPADAKAWTERGVAAMQRGALGEAETALRHAIALDPRHAPAHRALAAVAFAQHRFDESADAMRACVEIETGSPQLHAELGHALTAARRFDDAAAAFERALALDPANRPALAGLGTVLFKQNRFIEAESHCRRALERDPSSYELHLALGSLLITLGRPLEAQAAYRAALALRPDDLRTRSALLFALNSQARETPDSLVDEARAYGRLASARASPFTSWHCERDPGRLRVGLVSGDLGQHPVGYFLDAVLGEGEFDRIEWIAYSTVAETDDLSARLQRRMSAWRTIARLSDGDAARQIHADGVHVLFDLAGHAPNNGLPVFAWRPAPVQVAWLGYFATTGVAEMDDVIADEMGVPARARARFTETVRYLPDTRLCFTPPSEGPTPGPLPALERGYVTFGSFQALQKLTDETLSLWGRVLAALPASRLRLQNKAALDPGMRASLLARLAARGIVAARVDLEAPAARAEYLAAHRRVDVILDSFPYPGGTTTCEALWMGVPTITLAGESLLARQGASLLAAAGLPDWIATTEEEYVAKAVAQASDVASLAGLREGLRERVRVSALFDARRFATNLEALIVALWRERGTERLR